jgi:hypothetical protein
MATYFMGPTAANLFNRFLEDRAVETFFILQGRQLSIVVKPGGKKELKEPLLRPVRRRCICLSGR